MCRPRRNYVCSWAWASNGCRAGRGSVPLQRHGREAHRSGAASQGSANRRPTQVGGGTAARWASRPCRGSGRNARPTLQDASPLLEPVLLAVVRAVEVDGRLEALVAAVAGVGVYLPQGVVVVVARRPA